MSIDPEVRVLDQNLNWRAASELRPGMVVHCRRGGAWWRIAVTKVRQDQTRYVRIVRTRTASVMTTPDCHPYAGTPPRIVEHPIVGDMILLSNGANLYVEKIEMIEHVEFADPRPMVSIELAHPGNLIADEMLVGPWSSH